MVDAVQPIEDSKPAGTVPPVVLAALGSKGDPATFLALLEGQNQNAAAKNAIEQQHNNGKSYKDIWFDALKHSVNDAGNAAIVKEMATNAKNYDNFDVNSRDLDGQTALYFAGLTDNKDLINSLINDGHIDVTSLDDANESAYQYIDHVLKSTPDSSEPGSESMRLKEGSGLIRDSITNQLNQAVKDGKEEDALAAIAAGADPQAGSGNVNISLLSYAAGKSDSNTVKALVNAIPESDRAAFINQKGADGRTAMHSAADAGDTVSYQFLKSAGGDETIKADNGKSAKDLLGPGVEDKAKRNDPALDDLRKKYGIDPEGDIDYLRKQAKDGKGTVQQEALLNLYNKYKDMVDNGKAADDSVQAKFVRALQAQSAIQSGYTILPYDENKTVGGTKQDFGDPVTLTPADTSQMFDSDKVQKQLATLFQDPTVLGDYNNGVKSLAKDIGVDTGKTADKLYDQITGAGYTQFLQAAKDAGLGDDAQTQVQNDIAALSALDPARGTNAGKILQQNGITADIEKYMADPSLQKDTGPESQGIASLFSLLRSQITSQGVNIPRTMIGAIDGILGAIEGKNGKLNEESARALTEIFKGVSQKATGSDGNMNPDALQHAIDDAKLPTDLKPNLLKNLQVLNTKGVLGTIVGTSSLIGAVANAVFGRPGTQAGIGQGNVPVNPAAETGAILSWLSFSPAYAKLAASLTKDNPNAKNIVSLLGMDKSLPEIWGKNGSIGSNLPTPPQEIPLPESGTSTPVPGDEPGAIELDNLYNGASQATADEAASLANGGEEPPLPPQITQELNDAHVGVDITTAQKIVGTAAKILGAVGDFGGGIAGIVTSAIDLKSADTPEQKAIDALGIESGLLGTAAGGIELAGLIVPTISEVIAGAGLIVGVSFAASAIFAGIGLIIADAVQHKKMADAASSQDTFLRNLDKDGLLKDGWQDKLEYARYETYSYYGRDAPADQSLFDYQSAEFDHFRNTPGKDGSSNNRLDPNLHKHYDATDRVYIPGEPDQTANNGNPQDEPPPDYLPAANY